MNDSTRDTQEHIAQVQSNVLQCIGNLHHRGEIHDASKLESPEKEIFDSVGKALKELEYGSEAYFEQLKEMRPALDHHYAVNRHHPEHWDNGVSDMSLFDLLEMLCDWRAATLRMRDGDLRKSIDFNQGRFGYTDEVREFLLHTAAELGWINGEEYGYETQ